MVDAPATTPTKEDEAKKLAAAAATTTPTAGANAKKFEGDGVPYKAKLIGMEDLSVDRDEKICLDSMFKLKAVVKARGEHKQRIQLNLTMSAVKVIDDTTKAQIATHEIERISFVVIDPRDTRAFGYIYNTSDDRHQFWAIKTERSAAVTVLALKELFEAAFEQFSLQQKDGTDATKPPAASPVSPATVAIAQTAATTPVTPPQPTAPSLLDDSAWGDAPSAASTPLVIQAPPRPPVAAAAAPIPSISTDLWDVSPSVATPPAPAARKDDSLDDIFGNMSAPAPVPSTNMNAMFNGLSFATPAPAPVMNNLYPNMYPQPTPAAFPNVTPMMGSQQPMMPAAFPNVTPMMPQQQLLTPSNIFPQQDLLAAAPISPIAPPTVTNPMNDFGLLDLSSPPVIKPNKDAFFPNAIPNKSIQQLQAEKKRNPFS